MHGDAAATASTIAAHEWLFRFGIVSSLTGELLPQDEHAVFMYGQPAFFGELALMLWLLIKGANPPVGAGVGFQGI